jgi:hypothetical protein
VEAVGQVFSDEAIDAAFRDDIAPLFGEGTEEDAGVLVDMPALFGGDVMPFYFGLDLGQTQDYTASIVLEAHGEGDTRTYDARHIEPWPLGTSYPSIVQAVRSMLNRPPLHGQCTLVVDHTGVGRPIFDLFVEAKIEPIIGITITGGLAWHRDTGRQWHVAKILLVGTVQKFLQSGRLRIGAKLPHARTLQKELRDFRVKITKAANEMYEACEGAHDDLVLSLAVALFAAEHPGWTWAPVGQTHAKDSFEPLDQFMSRRGTIPAGWLLNR